MERNHQENKIGKENREINIKIKKISDYKEKNICLFFKIVLKTFAVTSDNISVLYCVIITEINNLYFCNIRKAVERLFKDYFYLLYRKILYRIKIKANFSYTTK